jgi:hypothetical protein
MSGTGNFTIHRWSASIFNRAATVQCNISCWRYIDVAIPGTVDIQKLSVVYKNGSIATSKVILNFRIVT